MGGMQHPQSRRDGQGGRNGGEQADRGASHLERNFEVEANIQFINFA